MAISNTDPVITHFVKGDAASQQAVAVLQELLAHSIHLRGSSGRASVNSWVICGHSSAVAKCSSQSPFSSRPAPHSPSPTWWPDSGLTSRSRRASWAVCPIDVCASCPRRERGTGLRNRLLAGNHLRDDALGLLIAALAQRRAASVRFEASPRGP
jgi:hypothetical protein